VRCRERRRPQSASEVVTPAPPSPSCPPCCPNATLLSTRLQSSFHFPKTTSSRMDAAMLAKRAQSMQAVADAGWASINSAPTEKTNKSRQQLRRPAQRNPLSKEEMSMVRIERDHPDTTTAPLMTNNERHARYPTSAPRDYGAYLYALEPWRGAGARFSRPPGRSNKKPTPRANLASSSSSSSSSRTPAGSRAQTPGPATPPATEDDPQLEPPPPELPNQYQGD